MSLARFVSIETLMKGGFRNFVNKYKNNRSLNQVLKEIEYVQCDYVDKMKDIKDRIMNEINL